MTDAIIFELLMYVLRTYHLLTRLAIRKFLGWNIQIFIILLF